jgi:hypothetical protein
MPSDNGLRLNENQCLLPSTPERPQDHPEQSVRNSKSRLRMPLPQNRKLLPKREIFQKQVAARANRFNKQDEQELQQTRHKSVVAEMQDNLAIGFAAMANANDFDDGFVPKLKEEAIVAAAEAEPV